jgi:hypothetical protein
MFVGRRVKDHLGLEFTECPVDPFKAFDISQYGYQVQAGEFFPQLKSIE